MAWIRVKMAVVPPMPSASVRMAAMVKMGAMPELAECVAEITEQRRH